MMAAAALSLVLLALYFTRWWTVGILISFALAAAAWRVQQPA
jgi:hypothetical protein